MEEQFNVNSSVAFDKDISKYFLSFFFIMRLIFDEIWTSVERKWGGRGVKFICGSLRQIFILYFSP